MRLAQLEGVKCVRWQNEKKTGFADSRTQAGTSLIFIKS